MAGSGAAPADARGAYDAMIRDVISPAMRALGFKGSGGSYVLPVASAWVLVGFQRSVHDDRELVEFTVNLTVASKRAWEAVRLERPYLSERPAPNTRYGPPTWQRRLGALMSAQTDVWWRVTVDSDVGRVGDEVVTAVREYAVPMFEREVARLRDETP
jgi:hypothetical protein